MKGPRVHVIGVEPGARFVSDEALEAIRSCALLVGAARHLELVPGFPGEILAVEGRVADAATRVATQPDLRAAFLASGDPGFFGIASVLLRKIPRQEVRLWPAVSSMQLAFARAGVPWSDARFGSLHGRPLEAVAPLLGASRVGLFTDGSNTPSALAQYLIEAGWGDCELFVAEDLGLPSERLSRGAPAEFLRWQGSSLNVVLILRSGPDPRRLGPGIPDDAFSHSRGLITKAEVRAAALGALSLPRRGVVWDVGAGSGSLAVECCLLSPEITTYAVERSSEGLGHIRENRRRFRAAGLVPVEGEAPEALEGLPPPDAVFVGGSGGNLDAILGAAWASLKPGGRLVAAAVLLETLSGAVTWGRRSGAEPALTEIRAARSRTVAGKHLLEPQNAVTLVRFTKPDVDGEQAA